MRRALPRILPLLAVCGLAPSLGCRVEVGPPARAEATGPADAPRGKVMVYTSMYRSVIDRMKPRLAAALPDVEVQWLQGGSEKLATRLDAELAAGAPLADLVLTSDPLWYERLHREGHLVPYASLRALRLPRDLVHPDGAHVTARLSVMVLAYDSRAVTAEEAPRRFTDLFAPRWKGKVTSPDPLASGTTFTTLAFLLHRHGPELLTEMAAADLVASGGNSSTLTRLESGEHQVGFVLLENLLAAAERDSPVRFQLPEEGPVLVPGPIALVRGGPNPRAARAVYDVLLSAEAQAEVVEGKMHSPFPEVAAPADAPPLSALLDTEYRWTPEFVDGTVNEAAAIRQRFAKAMGAP